ncbi:MAG: DNA replication protein DnaC, partial [Lawsonibacter sp.]|nr:DNA replication protein DnaC [Lawsonibacter sp.]
MSYDANVLRRANQRLEDQNRRRRDQVERLRQDVYARQPKLEQLDRRIQGTMAGLVAAALRQGGDPVQA